MTPRALVAVVVALACLLGACGGIPDDVRVHRVQADQDADESPVSYQPAGPRQNATPVQVVRGYLDAMLAYPVSSGTAERFLHPQADPWDATAGVSVYRSAEVGRARQVPVRGDTGLQVEVRLAEDARLDRAGRFRRTGTSRTVQFVLRRDDGQWRVEQAPAGTFVTRDFFADYYRPFDLFFFDPSGERVVADPVHLPLGEQLATALVTNVLAGPRPRDAGTLRSYVPAGVRLRGSVPVAGTGLADIVLDGLGDVPPDTRDRVSAQLVWTLRQLPEVSRLRIRPPGPVPQDESGTVEPVGAWGVFGPSRVWKGPYGVRDATVVRLDGDDVRRLDQRLVDPATIERVAVAPAGEDLAVVTAGGTSLVAGSVSGAGRRTVAGTGLVAPTWDGEGRLWVVDRVGAGTRVRVLGDTDDRLVLRGWPAVRPVSFALSRDQSRYALVARRGRTTTVLTGRVVSDASGRVRALERPTELPSAGPGVATWTAPRSVSFAGTGHLVLVARSAAGEPQVFTARVDGSAVTGGRSSEGPMLVDVDAREIVADPVSGRLHVRDADGQVWQSDGAAAWTRAELEGVTTLSPSG